MRIGGLLSMTIPNIEKEDMTHPARARVLHQAPMIKATQKNGNQLRDMDFRSVGGQVSWINEWVGRLVGLYGIWLWEKDKFKC